MNRVGRSLPSTARRQKPRRWYPTHPRQPLYHRRYRSCAEASAGPRTHCYSRLGHGLRAPQTKRELPRTSVRHSQFWEGFITTVPACETFAGREIETEGSLRKQCVPSGTGSSIHRVLRASVASRQRNSPVRRQPPDRYDMQGNRRAMAFLEARTHVRLAGPG